MQSEIRQNKVTKQWVIYAPGRGERPKDFQQDGERRVELPVHEPACPFCPGNEQNLSAILLELPHHSSGQWQTRVVPNKYPVVTPDGGTERYMHGIYLAMPGYGCHEVIIEHPHHNQDIATMTLEQVGCVIETYHRRYVDLMREYLNMMIIIFRNHGPRAGTSLIHPHSQLVVTGMVPNSIRWREEEAQRYFDEWGRCVYHDILAFELHDQQRVILENESFVAFVPFAAEVPFEVWIMPRRPQADFSEITDAEKADLAQALREVLGRLHRKLHDPDYNYILNTPARYKTDEPHLQWYVQIRPRLTTPAGFEIGSGISVNPALPEDNAEVLRR